MNRRRHARLAPEVTRPAVSTAMLCLAGVLVSGYLAWTKLTNVQALFCSTGGGCDIVQASRYATLLGVPTALWGAVLYASIGVLAWLGFTRQRWQWAMLAASAGVAFSAYLTTVSLFVLRAACPYCLASAVIEVAVLADVIRRSRHVEDARERVPRWRILTLGGITAGATVLVTVAIFSGGPADATPYQVGLARHLAATNAVMYGAYWCPHCRDQKDLFASAGGLLPYVECDSRGERARPDLCLRAQVRSFPTWVIGSQRFEGVQTIETLARASNFSP
jgi:uncharacterized membrane protein/glutaredoxin